MIFIIQRSVEASTDIYPHTVVKRNSKGMLRTTKESLGWGGADLE